MTPDMQRAVDRLLADRERQGFPRYVTDPVALAKIATLLRDVVLPLAGGRKTRTAAGRRPARGGPTQEDEHGAGRREARIEGE